MVYGSPDFQHHKSLWKKLGSIAENVIGGWTILGYFNIVLQTHDRIWVLTTLHGRVQEIFMK